MSRLLNKHSYSRTEAQAFFAENHAFPLVGTAVGFLALANVASAMATLLAF
jgi:hypothetical protein